MKKGTIDQQYNSCDLFLKVLSTSTKMFLNELILGLIE